MDHAYDAMIVVFGAIGAVCLWEIRRLGRLVLRATQAASVAQSNRAEAMALLRKATDLVELANEDRAALRSLLSRLVKYAHEDRAVTPKRTRLARCLREAEAHLGDERWLTAARDYN